MMDSYELLCYVCLKINCNLQNMCSDNKEMMKLRETFVLCVPEVDMQQLSTLFICDECCDVIQSINRFRDLCLKNIKVFNKNLKSLKPHDKFYEKIHDNDPAVQVNLHECYSIVKSEPLSMDEDDKVSGTENIKNADDLEEVEPLVEDNRESTSSIRKKRKIVNYETDSEKDLSYIKSYYNMPSTVGSRGKILNSQAREVIANVMQFMKEEAGNGQIIPLTKFKERVLAATKIGEYSYRKIQGEVKQISAGQREFFSSPNKNRNRPSPKSHLTEGELKSIRSIIHDYYIIEKRQPTLKGIRQKIVNSGVDFKGGLTTLMRVIKKLGFQWRATSDRGKMLMESIDIRYKRTEYLTNLKRCIEDQRPIIFTDESYINSNHVQSKTWNDDSSKCFTKSIGKGPRVVMVHAGGTDGFVNNCLLMFKSGSKSGDYQDDMNHSNYMKWVRTQLIPNLPPRAALVIDNASYHNVCLNNDPTSTSSKAEMATWLSQRGFIVDPKATKPSLYNLVKMHKSKCKQYVLDTELQKHGYVVLRLPPYHPELNPIEKIWAIVKNWVAAHNVTCKLTDVMKLANDKFNSIGPEEWKTVCDHVNQVVEEFLEKEHLIDDAEDNLRFVVNTGESDDEWSQIEDDEEIS